MTIDVAIAHIRNEANSMKQCAEILCCTQDFFADIEYHKQLAEWLEELKEYKLKEFQCHLAREEGISIGYEKGIDDFAEKLKNHYQCYDIDLCLQDNDHFSYTDSFLALESYIDEIAQQLKAGGIDGNDRTDT